MKHNQNTLISWLNNKIKDLGDFKEFKLINYCVSRKTSVIDFTNKTVVTRQAIIKHHAATQALHREFNTQNLLYNFFPVPKPIIFCNNKNIAGHSFYVMEYSDGQLFKDFVLQKNSSEKLLLHAKNSFQELINLHSLKLDDIGIKNKEPKETYIKNQIIRWSKEYNNISEKNFLNLQNLLVWFFENIPTTSNQCMIHNDWRMDNIIFSKSGDGSILSVLDWELFSIGDPLMDFGIAMGYWIEESDSEELKSLSLAGSHIKNFPKKEEIINFYFNKSNQKDFNWNFYYSFGLFKFASILQRGSNLYHSGIISNKKYENLDDTIIIILQKAKKVAASK